MSILRNIRLFLQTRQVIEQGCYFIGESCVELPPLDFRKAIVCEGIPNSPGPVGNYVSNVGTVTVFEDDSLNAAMNMPCALVLNFSNAHVPGGGVWLGASSQEESLCRRSSLYLSLSSKSAARMYRRNNLHIRALESDLMVLSPNVCVIRDSDNHFLKEPRLVSVISMPAPNRRGMGLFVSREKLKEGLFRKITNMFSVASRFGYRNLVLGAWGCGAFGNDPNMVAECFRSALYDKGWLMRFDRVVFAIASRKDRRNFRAFEEIFQGAHYEPGDVCVRNR